MKIEHGKKMQISKTAEKLKVLPELVNRQPPLFSWLIRRVSANQQHSNNKKRLMKQHTYEHYIKGNNGNKQPNCNYP